MNLIFHKYQGTGNDFIIIDQRVEKKISHADYILIEKLCDRRFGIGADGLILLENSETADFDMVYFNADGHQSTMCGNGGRCLAHFAWTLNLFNAETNFNAIDGLHQAKILSDGTISLKMKDVEKIEVRSNNVYILNTGSPHFVKICAHLPSDIKKEGSVIRYSPEFNAQGINVNFVTIKDKIIEIATYERGVEDETLSCGTGVTAAAIAYGLFQKIQNADIKIKTKGGELTISFVQKDLIFTDIWLTGPAKKVFTGEISI